MPPRLARLIVLLALSLLAVPLAAVAQPATKVYRIGILSPAYRPQDEAFRQGLRERGYTEGQHLALEYRYGSQLRALATEFPG